MFVRAAQAAGIPYFYKNTTTLNKNLRPVTSYAQLKPGDLIWIPGHVIIVADLQRNTIIEAVGYQSGYGKIHEIPLSSLFKGIKTYHDLIDAYNGHKPLQRLNNKGAVICTIKTFNILSLDALWA